MERALRLAVCFVLLPALAGLALAVLDSGQGSAFRDRIVLIVLVGVVASLLSAALALRAGRPARVAALYGLATAVLSAAAVGAVLVAILTLGPSED